MNVKGGTTDVTTYFDLRLAADDLGATGLTISDFDAQYTRSGAAPSTKVDLTALSTTSDAHADSKGIEVDATSSPGLYRIDWPDAAFAAGVPEVILSIKVATVKTVHMHVGIDTPELTDLATITGADGATLATVQSNYDPLTPSPTLTSPALATLSIIADEGSTYFVTINFTDEDGVAVIPETAVWSLTDGDGTVINSRSDVSISTPAATEIIELSGADLTHSGGPGLEREVLTVEATYDGGKPLNSAVSFFVRNLLTVT